MRSVADAEVGDLHAALLRPHDVLRLDVAVDDPLPVRGREPAQGLVHDVQRDLPRKAPGHLPEAVELAAVDVFHDDVRVRRRGAAVEELDDVRVPKGDLDADLVEEAVEEVRIVGDVGQDLLQGDLPAGLLVHGQEDLGHAAERDALDDPVMIDLAFFPGFGGHDDPILLTRLEKQPSTRENAAKMECCCAPG